MKKDATSSKIKAFTLIELSIVLVIISLIVGGVIGGKSLITSSEIQNIISDVKKYETAFNTFNLQYDALAGDMRDATSYWTSCTDSGANTCNGNGNNIISGSGGLAENVRAWQHLSLSGIINQTFNGLGTPLEEAYPSTSMNIIIDVLSFGFADSALGTQTFYGKSGNFIYLYTIKEIENRHLLSLDKKMDDGIGFSGRIYGTNFDPSTPCSTSNYTDATGDWLKTGTSKSCMIAYWLD